MKFSWHYHARIEFVLRLALPSPRLAAGQRRE
jgi:hypothetical protein